MSCVASAIRIIVRQHVHQYVMCKKCLTKWLV